MKFNIHPSRAALMHAVAAELAAIAEDAIRAKSQACLALSGGDTPAPAYRALAQARLDWPAVRFALVDERFVSPEHPASNEGLLRRTLAPALAAGARLLPLYTPLISAAAAAAAAEQAYAPLHIDCALMGMGDDGHTASWFAGALGDVLDTNNPRTVVAVHAPHAAGAADRLTLTRAALQRAERVLMLIAGNDKRDRLLQAAEETPPQSPVAALLADRDLEIHWAE